jgi:negative regulator of flagellin synthesis FlgM
MKIDKPVSQIPPGVSGNHAARGTAKGSSGAPPASPQPDSTSVSLGATASQLRGMESSMANAPVIDSAKVAEIRQAISEGRFKVNSGMVADRLIETVRDLIDNKA